MKEVWKPMKYKDYDFSNVYFISNCGRVYSKKSNKILSQTLNKETGYFGFCISLGSRKRKKYIKTHIAVAFNFVDGYKECLMVNHKDGNKKNNNSDNLEWVTNSENTQHAYDNGMNNRQIKVKCLNTGEIFPSISKACEWCGLSLLGSSIRGYLNKYSKRKYAGRHPITKEPLQWEHA